MTLPHERTRAVIATADFLLRLASPYNGGLKGIPSPVRQKARALLKHMPTRLDLSVAGRASPEIFAGPYGDE